MDDLQTQFEVKYLNKVARLHGGSLLSIPNGQNRTFKFTAVLTVPFHGEWVVAVISSHYSPENPEWYTFKCKDFAEFKDVLDQFELIKE